MRYFVQFVIPALIFLSLVYVVGHKRGGHSRDDSNTSDNPIMSNSTFVLCLVVGSGFTVALLFGIAQL